MCDKWKQTKGMSNDSESEQAFALTVFYPTEVSRFFSVFYFYVNLLCDLHIWYLKIVVFGGNRFKIHTM